MLFFLKKTGVLTVLSDMIKTKSIFVFSKKKLRRMISVLTGVRISYITSRQNSDYKNYTV